MKRQINQSEIQLNGFLEHTADVYTTLLLRPQGDYTAISEAAVNICEVCSRGNTFLFGGISEPFYDEMVSKYDWREESVKTKKTNVFRYL